MASSFRFAGIAGAPYTPVIGCFISNLYKELGWHSEYIALPPRRALRLSSSGELDGELYRIGSLSSAYPSLLIVRPEITRMRVYAYSALPLAGLPGWAGLTDLRVGFIQGYLYAEKGTEGVQDKVAVAHVGQLLEMYLKGRLDLIVIDDLHALQYRDQLAAVGLKRVEPELDTIALYHYVHERHAESVSLLAAKLAELNREGRKALLLKECRRQAYGSD